MKSVINNNDDATYRFVRDESGRVIPASLAGTSLLKGALEEDTGRDVKLPPVGHPYVTQPMAKYLWSNGQEGKGTGA